MELERVEKDPDITFLRGDEDIVVRFFLVAGMLHSVR